MARHTRITSGLFPAVIVYVAAMMSVDCNPKVTESTSQYSCCNPEIRFDQDCEHTWSIDKMTIAHFDHESKECVPPCKMIEGGVMTLDECASVYATVVHTNEMNVTSEMRIYYNPQPCSGSVSARGNQGFVTLMLLVLMNTLIVL